MVFLDGTAIDLADGVACQQVDAFVGRAGGRESIDIVRFSRSRVGGPSPFVRLSHTESVPVGCAGRRVVVWGRDTRSQSI